MNVRVFVAMPVVIGVAILLSAGYVKVTGRSLSQPIRLFQALNYLATMALWVPLVATTLVLRAFDRASDATYDARKRRRAEASSTYPSMPRLSPARSSRRFSVEAEADEDEPLFSNDDVMKYSNFTVAELPQWVLFIVYLVVLLVTSAVYEVLRIDVNFVGLAVLATVGVALSAWLIRNLVAAVMRRQQDSTIRYVRTFRLRGYTVAAVQAVLFAVGLARSISSPWLIAPLAYDPTINPCALVSDSYVATHCVRDLTLRGRLLSCFDGGYAGYNSTLAACDAARGQEGYIAEMASALMLSFNGFLFLVFRELWRLHDRDVDEARKTMISTERRRGSRTPSIGAAPAEASDQLATFRMASSASGAAGVSAELRVRLHFIAKACTLLALAICPIFLSILLTPRAPANMLTVDFDNPLMNLIASGALAYINIGFWCLSFLAFNVDSIFEALIKYVGPGARRPRDIDVWLKGMALPESLREKLHEVAAAMGGLRDVRARGVDLATDDKFVLEPKCLQTGRTNLRGLNHQLGWTDEAIHLAMAEGVAAIVREFDEHGTDADRECLDYVRFQAAGSSPLQFPPNGMRDCDEAGRLLPERTRPDGMGMVLADFVAHPNSRTAGLTEAHVLALRLYTTNAYKSLNNPLRARTTSQSAPHPFPVTVNFITSAIGRLRTVHENEDDANQAQDLFRGMRDLTVDAEVNRDFLERGGTEPAPMSTTSDLRIAMRYAASQTCLLFTVHTESFQERGADVSYLSAFPVEAECLYPPMTALRPTGEKLVETIDGATVMVMQVTPKIELGF